MQGEARSDQDMFASLRERAVDLEGEEEEMEREEGALLTAQDTAEGGDDADSAVVAGLGAVELSARGSTSRASTITKTGRPTISPATSAIVPA